MTLNTSQSPVVLTLDERTGSETVDLQRYGVRAFLYIFRDVEFRWQIRILAVADALTVNPEIIAVSYTVEANIDVAPVPVVGQRELTAIGAYGVRHVAIIREPSWTLGHDAIGVAVV